MSLQVKKANDICQYFGVFQEHRWAFGTGPSQGQYFSVFQGHRWAFDTGPSQGQDVCTGLAASTLAFTKSPSASSSIHLLMERAQRFS